MEAQLAAGELPPETASALQRMRAELQAADARQKVRPACDHLGMHLRFPMPPCAALSLRLFSGGGCMVFRTLPEIEMLP